MKTVLGSLGFIVASATEVLAVKYLNYTAGWHLPFLAAILMNSFSVLLLPVWGIKFAGGRGVEAMSRCRLLLVYAALGCIAFAASIARSVSLNIVPGSVFALMMSSSVLFTTLLSRVLLGKRQHILQYLAALLAAAAVSVAASTTLTTDGSESADTSR